MVTNLLLIDDDADTLLLTGLALAEINKNIKLYSEANCLVALERLNAKDDFRPDLILLDLNMPLQHGRDILKELKSHPLLKEIPTVIFSTSSLASDVLDTALLGAVGFIVKPTAFKAMVKVLKNAIDSVEERHTTHFFLDADNTTS